MKIIITILTASILSQSALATPLNLKECLSDHRSILYRHTFQVRSQVDRLIRGIEIEKSRDAPKSKIHLLKQMLGRSIIKEYVLRDVIRQTNMAMYREPLASDPKAAQFARDLINTDEIALDANISHHKSNPAAFLLHKYKDEVVVETFMDLGEELYHSVGNGTVVKIISGSYSLASFEGALISFGSNVLKGAGFSAAIGLIATPLTGARLSPEDLWLKMLSKRPELIVNPEWMNEAGSPDAPWFAHCLAIQRKEKAILNVVKTLNQSEESEFLNKILFTEKKYQVKMELPKALISDNTSVANTDQPYADLPVWAILK